jgi:hypothetical protein
VYQLYAMLAMHFYRFCGRDSLGTTAEWVARELQDKARVCFEDSRGNRVLAELETTVVLKVEEGEIVVEQRLQQMLESHI